MVHLPQRDAAGPFVCAVDHCFSIKGQGTVMTGTILSGSVAVNDVCKVMKSPYVFLCRLKVIFFITDHRVTSDESDQKSQVYADV